MLLPAVACCCHRVWHANNAAGAVLLAALPRPRPAPRRAAFLIANTSRERAPARQNLKTPFCLHRGTHTHPTHTQRDHTYAVVYSHWHWDTLHVARSLCSTCVYRFELYKYPIKCRAKSNRNQFKTQTVPGHTLTRIHRGTIKVTDTTTRVEQETETETESSTELSGEVAREL